MSASFSTGPSNPLVPGDYGIAFAQLNFAAAPGYNAAYYPGDESADCPSCGGSVTIKTYEEEQSMAGSASVTMVRINPPPGDGELPEVSLDVDFVAAFGSQSNASSPYAQCSIIYSD